jgi:hypothetical protein
VWALHHEHIGEGGSKPSQLTGDGIFLIVYNLLYNIRYHKLRVNSSGRMLVDDALERIRKGTIVV